MSSSLSSHFSKQKFFNFVLSSSEQFWIADKIIHWILKSKEKTGNKFLFLFFKVQSTDAFYKTHLSEACSLVIFQYMVKVIKKPGHNLQINTEVVNNCQKPEKIHLFIQPVSFSDISERCLYKKLHSCSSSYQKSKKTRKYHIVFYKMPLSHFFLKVQEYPSSTGGFAGATP